MEVVLYTRRNCPLCDKVRATLVITAKDFVLPSKIDAL